MLPSLYPSFFDPLMALRTEHAESLYLLPFNKLGLINGWIHNISSGLRLWCGVFSPLFGLHVTLENLNSLNCRRQLSEINAKLLKNDPYRVLNWNRLSLQVRLNNLGSIFYTQILTTTRTASLQNHHKF